MESSHPELARSVQRALQNHKVEEPLSSTVEFLGRVLGGMVGTVFHGDEEHQQKEIEYIVSCINDGIDMGVPESD